MDSHFLFRNRGEADNSNVSDYWTKNARISWFAMRS
jgi:hypothetical protein